MYLILNIYITAHTYRLLNEKCRLTKGYVHILCEVDSPSFIFSTPLDDRLPKKLKIKNNIHFNVSLRYFTGIAN